MPEPWEWVVIVALAYAVAIYLRYLEWLSDDRNFPSVAHPDREWQSFEVWSARRDDED